MYVYPINNKALKNEWFSAEFVSKQNELGESLFYAIRWHQSSEFTYFGLDVYK